MELGKFFCAIDKLTGLLTRPLVNEAFSGRKYKCLDKTCGGDVIFCAENSVSVRPYFRHVSSGGSCQRYSKPTPETIHDEAARVMKSLLETSSIKFFETKCMLYGNSCGIVWEEAMCKATIRDDFILNDRYDPSNCRLEADLSWYRDGKLFKIFEIKHTHATEEGHRPEPWFEVIAEDVLTSKKNELGYYVFENVRNTGLKDACKHCLERHARECEEAKLQKENEEQERLKRQQKELEQQKRNEQARIQSILREKERMKEFTRMLEEEVLQDEIDEKIRLEQQKKDNEMIEINKKKWLENEKIKKIKYDEEQEQKRLKRIENEKIIIALKKQKELEEWEKLPESQKQEQLEINELIKSNETRIKTKNFDY